MQPQRTRQNSGTQRLPFRMKVGLIGFFGGLFGGLLGIGGSFLVIPFLTGTLGLTPHKAHATALSVAMITGISAFVFYFLSGHVDFALSRNVMVGSLLGVALGARLMRYLKGHWLSILFGFFLFFVATGYALDWTHSLTVGATLGHSMLKPASLGLFAGLVSGLFGAGGGAILVPGAVLLLHVHQQLAQGVSLTAIFPTTLLGTLVHYREGNLSSEVAPGLMAAAFSGGLLGGFLAGVLWIGFLKGLLIAVLLFIGGRNVWKNWPKPPLHSTHPV